MPRTPRSKADNPTTRKLLAAVRLLSGGEPSLTPCESLRASPPGDFTPCSGVEGHVLLNTQAGEKHVRQGYWHGDDRAMCLRRMLRDLIADALASSGLTAPSHKDTAETLLKLVPLAQSNLVAKALQKPA